MDIKELNKSQLILLAILVSFITSIATGIATVSLMQQGPRAITVPINRVVQQTVEKIVPGVASKETVVIKEEDLVVDAISKNQPSFFSVTKEVLGLDGKLAEVSLGHGFVVSKDGMLAVDATLVSEPGTYYATSVNGKFRTDFISVKDGGFSFLKLGAPVDPNNKASFVLPTFADTSKMKVGQKVIVLGNSISSFIFDGNQNLNIAGNKANAGGMVLDLDGGVLGMILARETDSFIPISKIQEALK